MGTLKTTILGMQANGIPEKTQGSHVVEVSSKQSKNRRLNVEQDLHFSLQSYLADIDEAAVGLLAAATSLSASADTEYNHRVDLKGRNYSQSMICAACAIVMGEYAQSLNVLFGEQQRVLGLRGADCALSVSRRPEAGHAEGVGP
jgi:hypothetical protein